MANGFIKSAISNAPKHLTFLRKHLNVENYATNRKVTGSIPNEDIEFLN
jgi:hypothetical protein